MISIIQFSILFPGYWRLRRSRYARRPRELDTFSLTDSLSTSDSESELRLPIIRNQNFRLPNNFRYSTLLQEEHNQENEMQIQ